MKIRTRLVSAAVALWLVSIGATLASAQTGAPAIKPVKERFLISHSSSVYKKPDSSSPVVGTVKGNSHVNVIGISADWLKVKLANGKIGYVPTSAAQ